MPQEVVRRDAISFDRGKRGSLTQKNKGRPQLTPRSNARPVAAERQVGLTGVVPRRHIFLESVAFRARRAKERRVSDERSTLAVEWWGTASGCAAGTRNRTFATVRR